MTGQDPTFIGRVAAVSGATVQVHLAKSVGSGTAIIEGHAYRIGQVGSFVRIPQGYQALYAVVSDVGASAVSDDVDAQEPESGRWMRVQLVGEAIGSTFERGIGQHPSIGDGVHLVAEADLKRIYGASGRGQAVIGTLSSAENIRVRVSLDELVTRHSAVLGSTGSGKSTTVASLLRSIVSPDEDEPRYPNARVLLLDIHGEYATALSDIARVYSVNPQAGEEMLRVPYWALDASEIIEFLTGGVSGTAEIAFTDKMFELKRQTQLRNEYAGIDSRSLTVDSPIPFSLKALWYDLINIEVKTFEGVDRDQEAKIAEGDPNELVEPRYKPHGMGSKPPYINQNAAGITRPLNLLRSRLLDRRYDFLLHPGEWEPALDGSTDSDLDALLEAWLGGSEPVTILDLSGVPSASLVRMVGSMLKIVFESLYWSREKTEGGILRPLLVVMEEAHRYLGPNSGALAAEVVQRMAKEGRKYGVGAMVVSQRPSEVDETILSQCGTFFVMRLSNPQDRDRVRGALPDNLAGLMDLLPVLRTGEAIISGEAARMPMRCRVALPRDEHRPASADPDVARQWALPRRQEGYERVVASWRAQSPTAVAVKTDILREQVEDDSVPS